MVTTVERTCLPDSDAVPVASHVGELDLLGTKIPCAVLPDGSRVLSSRGFRKAIGFAGRPMSGRGGESNGLQLPHFFGLSQPRALRSK